MGSKTPRGSTRKAAETTRPPSATTTGTPGNGIAWLRSSRWLLALAIIYGVWLCWLLYVALVNIRAGNQ